MSIDYFDDSAYKAYIGHLKLLYDLASLSNSAYLWQVFWSYYNKSFDAWNSPVFIQIACCYCFGE